ncbi:MAG: dihydropteroate synthase [Bacteroidetes bacterium]|nr:dihydropteroate synthase [Bacteroidota bacterium]
MGILNITPDSFFDGGRYANEKSIIAHVEKMLDEGASIIDIGANSTRPGAMEVSENEELKRLLPVIKNLRKRYDRVIISADTFRSGIARKAIEAGADIINDISGGTMDNNMFATVADIKAPYILMHIQGTPKTMQKDPQYINVVEEVKSFFQKKIQQLNSSGIQQIIIDPGFGFGKTLNYNFALLKNLKEFRSFGYPVLAGLSRKSMINKVLGTLPADALNGTTVLNTLALLNGASILRVHDVKEAVETIKLVREYLV